MNDSLLQAPQQNTYQASKSTVMYSTQLWKNWEGKGNTIISRNQMHLNHSLSQSE